MIDCTAPRSDKWSRLANLLSGISKGIEIDGAYADIPRTSLRFSGAYNNAVYRDLDLPAPPLEYDSDKTNYVLPDALQPHRNIDVETIASAPKYEVNIGADYCLPVSLGVFGEKEFHTGANWAFTSYYNSNPRFPAMQ